jgi:tetratricopeptide (TPR) repeat protein
LDGTTLLSRPASDADHDPVAPTGDALRYCAFLSYSHADEKHAAWLHRRLERFHVPRALVGRGTPRGVIPPTLGAVFRDRQELAASSDLGASIRAALAQSNALIVLCSPAAAASRWTNEEIRSFNQLRPNGPVLAAIVSGEPFASEIAGREGEECFPPALRQRFDAVGAPTGARAEPTAADLRIGRDGRRLGLLKLVAGLLGIGLDELVQRETQRRQRRLATLSAASLVGMALTSILAVTAVQSRDEARDQRREAEGLVGFMLGDLRDKLEPIGRLDALDAVGSRALAYYQHQDKGDLSDEALAQRSRALTMIGQIANTRGDIDAALRRYVEALASTGEAVRRYPDDPARLFDHAQNVFWVGAIAYQRGSLEQAERYWRAYKSLADRMVAIEPGTKDYRLEVAYANTNLGTVLMDQRRYREAATRFGAALSVAETIGAAAPRNLTYQKNVSDALAWLADAHEYSGALNKALAERERQAQLLAELARIDPRDTQVQRDKMTAHRATGRLLAAHGDAGGGLKELQKGVAISDTLFRIEPENTEWLQANASGRFDLAELQLATGAVTAAAAVTRSGCEIADRLSRTNSKVADWKHLQRSWCLHLRARIALAGGNPEEGLAIARQLQAGAGKGLWAFRALSTAGDAQAALGNRAAAGEYWTLAVTGLPRGVELRPSERAEVAAVQMRRGKRGDAQRLASELSAIGYRYPTAKT